MGGSITVDEQICSDAALKNAQIATGNFMIARAGVRK
jgi:hypothetical protein